MPRFAPPAASAVVFLVLSACSGSSPLEPPAGTPYMRGPVASVTAGTAPARVLVRPGERPGAGPADPCGIRASVTSNTRLLRRSASGALTRAALGDVGVGDTVEVYVPGLVALSCPGQAEASAIVLVADASP